MTGILRLAIEKLRIDVGKLLKVFRKIVNRLDGIGGTDGHAGAAIDASGGVNIELGGDVKGRLVLFGVNAVRGADVHAEKVFDTSAGDYISHLSLQEKECDFLRLALDCFAIRDLDHDGRVRSDAGVGLVSRHETM
jgi:hypothetical protein